MAAAPAGVPAHRVVNREGELSGRHAFTGGPREMEKRLRSEGVEVEQERVVDFQRLLWLPLEDPAWRAPQGCKASW